MPKFEIYTKALCPFCIRAKALFKQKNVEVIDIPAARAMEKRREMNDRSNGRNT